MAYKIIPPGGLSNGGTVEGDLDVTGAIITGVETGVTANADANQANAYAITNAMTIVATVAGDGDGVKLPTAAAGLQYTVVNDGANDLGIFPNTSDAIDDAAANAVYYLHPGSRQTFIAEDATTWRRQNRGLRFVQNTVDTAIKDESTMSTQDASWNDLDISADIPLSALGMPLSVTVQVSNASSNAYFGIRQNTASTSGIVPTKVSTVSKIIYNTGTVSTDAAGLLEYYISTSSTAADLYVNGWWVEG